MRTVKYTDNDNANNMIQARERIGMYMVKVVRLSRSATSFFFIYCEAMLTLRRAAIATGGKKFLEAIQVHGSAYS